MTSLEVGGAPLRIVGIACLLLCPLSATPTSVGAQALGPCNQPVQPASGESGYAPGSVPGVEFFCEGFIVIEVFDPGAEVWLAHLGDADRPVAPGRAGIPLHWPSEEQDQTVHVRAVTIPGLHARDYRMDAALPAGSDRLGWPGGNLLSYEVPPAALGFTAWTSLSDGGRARPVYLVLAADSERAATRAVRLGFLSNRAVGNAKLRYWLPGEEPQTVPTRSRDGLTTIGEGDLIEFELPGLAPGLYRAVFGATVSGDATTPLSEQLRFVVR